MKTRKKNESGLSRRDLFLLGGAGLWLLGCDSESAQGGPDAAPAIDGGPSPDGSLAVDAATPAVCDETLENIEGPYYRAGAPTRGILVDGATPGVRLSLSGVVRAVGTCMPLAGATVDLWQADDAAVYDSTGYNFRGKVLTAADGSYRFETVVPGHYLNGAQYRPAHIHVKLSAPGFPLLTTQLYFPNDPYNSIDPWYLPGLLIKTTDVGQAKDGRFDFALST